jgi:EmrB/QacA subfamily drug resistance transporter
MITRLATIPTSMGDRRRWIALAIVCLGQLMIMVDGTIVNVALPTIQRDLHFNPANLTWVVNAYLITYGSLVLLAGRAGDLVGRKKVFLTGIVLFTVASLLCGLAQDSAILVAARFLQGAGAALSGGVVIALIVTGFVEPGERAQAMSVFTFTIAGGGSLGLLAGGVLIQWINWHWIFFINLPIGLATLFLGRALIQENEGLGLRHGVDVWGSLLVTAALMVGAYAIVTAAEYGWASPHTLGFGGAAGALLVAFVGLEMRLANPIIPMRMLRIRSLSGASAARAMLATGMFTTFFVGALYLQHVGGYTAFGTGLAFLPATVAMAALSFGITARLMRRLGPSRLLAFGMLTVVVALVLLSGAEDHTTYFPRLFIAYALIGLGGGASFMPLTIIAMAEVPAADSGLAAGISNVAMQNSAAIGLAAIGTVAAGQTRSLIAQGHTTASALAGGYELGFTIAAGCVAVGLLIVLTVLRSSGRAALAVTEEEELEAEAEAA